MQTPTRSRSLVATLTAILVVSPLLVGTVAAKPKAPRTKEVKDTHFDAGQVAFDEGSYFTAVNELKLSITAAPSSRAYMVMGNAYLQLGQLDEARQAFDSARKLESRPARQAQVDKLIKSLESLPKAKMRIESTPPGATVYVDLKAAGVRGQTPMELTVLPGRHRIIYILDGYDDALATPDPVAIEGQEILVDAALRKKGCDVAISAQQKGVLAALDGDEQIPLPTTIRVTPGPHEVVMSGRGLQPKEVAFECVDFKSQKLDVSLPSTPGGMMQVHAPAGANVYIDGRATSRDEAARLSLLAGPHDVEVEAPGNAPWHATVVVRPSEQTDVTPQFRRAGMGITGLEVVAIPVAASIWFDGQPLAAGVMTATKPGPHLVEARALGHRPFLRKLDLSPGEITRVEARLQPDSLVPLSLGIAFGILAVGAEATAIVAQVKAGNEVQSSPEYNKWHAVEIAGQVTAGACAAVAITGIVLDQLQRRSGLEKPRDVASNATHVSVAPTTQGGAIVLGGTF